MQKKNVFFSQLSAHRDGELGLKFIRFVSIFFIFFFIALFLGLDEYLLTVLHGQNHNFERVTQKAWQNQIFASSCDEIECEKKEVDCEEGEECDSNQAQEYHQEYMECLEEQKQCWQGKISETKNKSNTLQNTIDLLNGQIYLQRLQVNQTKSKIDELQKDIYNLEERIIGLGLSLDNMAKSLLERIKVSYRQSVLNDTAPIFFSTKPISEFISQQKYLQYVELHTAQLMQKTEYQKMLYHEEKENKERKQAELEAMKDELVKQQVALEQKNQEKKMLLEETKNDEQRYQKLLSQAIAELNSLKSFTQSQVGNQVCLPSSPGQPNGWFWSQRDPKWCKQHIGYSSEIIGEVGCLISSVAMIWTKHGHDINPSQLASNPSHFSLRTAYMRHPLPAPPGFSYIRRNYRDYDLIDSELAADRPVIVHLSIGTVDGHFVVLKSGSNGDYVMNDPLYGANLKLTDHYSPSMIDSIRVFRD